jgi:hypothetical protein
VRAQHDAVAARRNDGRGEAELGVPTTDAAHDGVDLGGAVVDVQARPSSIGSSSSSATSSR